MADYNNVATFGSVQFGLSDVTASTQSSTLKTQIGKMLVERDIPLRDATDIILNVSGVLDGRSRTAGQTLAAAIEADRATLESLEDGTFYAWTDGKHVANFVIKPGSLVWADDANRATGQPYRFTMQMIQWR